MYKLTYSTKISVPSSRPLLSMLLFSLHVFANHATRPLQTTVRFNWNFLHKQIQYLAVTSFSVKLAMIVGAINGSNIS